MKTKRRKSLPLRTFSWSTKEKKNKGEIFVEKTITEWYEAKHQKASKEEIDYINSKAPKIFPFCGSINFVKNGHTKEGIQRFKCSDCYKSLIF